MTYTTDPPHADRRARPTQSTENGDTCDSCGRRFNVVYRVANTVWPQIAPHPETLGDYPEHQFGGILCPDCATEIAETKGIKLRFCAEHGWPRDNASATLDRAEKAEAQLATITAGLALEYVRVPEWCTGLGSDQHSAMVAIRCVATRIGVYGQLDDKIEELLPADRVETETDPAQEAFINLVRASIPEAETAMRKFPQPNYVISKFAEEAGEVVKASIHHAEGRETRENVVAEMRQTIAMMYRLWLEGDQVHGLPPLSGYTP